MRPLALVLLLTACAAPAVAQTPPFAHFADFTAYLDSLAAIPDATERERAIASLWADLRAADQIPFREGDSVAFLWRGTATTVAVPGDHSGWNPAGQNLTRVGLSTVWRRVYRFPADARIDYKLVLNGSNWILDPNNPHQQWSGFGPNSELRMPAWVFPEETVRRPEVPRGALSGNLQRTSTHLGYAVRYRVYTPAGYDGLSNLPTVYVTDGHEYSDDRLGAMLIVLDNLIHDGRAAPCVVVFVDPRDVVTGQNRRQEQYVQNPDFVAFLADELVPAIDAAYRTNPSADARVILGTSLGGVFSTYLGLLRPGVFRNLAIQSPAYWVSESPQWWEGPSLFEMMQAAPDSLFSIYLSTGTINDGEANARRMRDLFLANGYRLTYRERPEGHSWGQWRALLDEVLMALVPGPAVTGAEPVPGSDTGLRLDAFPNPTRGDATLRFALDAPADVALACFDARGRLCARPAAGRLGAGIHEQAVRLPSSGAYVCRVTAGREAATQTVTVAR